MSVFRFREFSIQQTNAAMKVGTDAMLLGALCRFESPASILDIGTGTGVLSLMVAQRFRPEKVTAIEIEPSAVMDAAVNFSRAGFSTSFELIEQDIRQWKTDASFDGIISNPPFFEQSSKSNSHERNLARHTDELPFSDLMRISAKLLAPKGLLWIIVPTAALGTLTDAGETSGLYLQETVHLHGKPDTPVRTIVCFAKEPGEVTESVFIIRNVDGSYTEAYIALTRAFHAVDLSLSSRK
jgi:tRNA1Val (adenine37-N6)-methyltransferase